MKFTLCKQLSIWLIGFHIFSAPLWAQEADILDLLQGNDARELSAVFATLSGEEVARAVATTFANGDTPLIHAAKKGDLELFEVLVEAGSDPNARDSDGRDALNIAVRTSNPELARLSIEAGTDPKAYTPRFRGSTLIFASERGEVAIVKLLVAAGAPLDRVNNLGWTALLEATILGDGGKAHRDIVRTLLDAGANPEIADRDGLTPLDHAKRRGHSEMVKLFARK